MPPARGQDAGSGWRQYQFDFRLRRRTRWMDWWTALAEADERGRQPQLHTPAGMKIACGEIMVLSINHQLSTLNHSPCQRQVVQRAGNPLAALLENMSVNHGRGDVAVAQ